MPVGSTDNYGLAKPEFNQVTWHDQVNGNFDLLDSILFSITGLSGFLGAWENATDYVEGDRVVDLDDASIWQCAVDHTSAATGTMEADRTANPTFWISITGRLLITGPWEADTVYNVGDVAYDTTEGLFGIANEAHTSSIAPATMRDDITSWDILFDSTFIANSLNIGFTPAGTIAATNIQDAIEELDSETQAALAALTASLAGKISTGDVAYLNPTGKIDWFAGAAAPTGWFLCDGSTKSRITEAALFAVIGTTFGAGDGVNTFTLPNGKDRGVIGKGNMGGVAANLIDAAIAGFDSDVLGATGGTDDNVIAQGNLPNVNLSSANLTGASTTNLTNGTNVRRGGSNTTAQAGPDRNVADGTSTDTITAATSTTIGGNVPLGGSGTPMSNMAPSLVLNMIIKN